MQSTKDRINLHTRIDCTRRFSYVHKCKFLDLNTLTLPYGFPSLVFAVVVIVVTAVVVAVTVYFICFIIFASIYLFGWICLVAVAQFILAH